MIWSTFQSLVQCSMIYITFVKDLLTVGTPQIKHQLLRNVTRNTTMLCTQYINTPTHIKVMRVTIDVIVGVMYKYIACC